jgi:hypothetical protein
MSKPAMVFKSSNGKSYLRRQGSGECRDWDGSLCCFKTADGVRPCSRPLDDVMKMECVVIRQDDRRVIPCVFIETTEGADSK